MVANAKNIAGNTTFMLKTSSDPMCTLPPLTCPICGIFIEDGTKQITNHDDVVMCSGVCSTLLHRHCAGLSKQAFKTVVKSPKPFFCPNCRLDKQELEIESLRELVDTLSREVKTLKNLVPVHEKVPNHHAIAPVSPPYAEGSDKSSVMVHDSHLAGARPVDLESERKYNLVITGIAECAPKMDRSTRQVHDTERIVEVFSSVHKTFSASSIKDIHRLGKFSPTARRPRPIFVKLLRASDVDTIIATKASLDSSVHVSRDLPKEVRAKQAVLRKEKQKLISAGVDHKSIRMERCNLFVEGKLFGSLDPADPSRFLEYTATTPLEASELPS